MFSLSRPRERGAAAVEMAIVLPLLLLVLGGIIDFGRALFIQNMATNAAREGARMRALGYTTAQADARVASAMIGAASTSYTITYQLAQGTVASPTLTVNGACPAAPVITDRQRVTVTPSFSFIFPLPLSAPTLTSQAEMRCGG